LARLPRRKPKTSSSILNVIVNMFKQRQANGQVNKKIIVKPGKRGEMGKGLDILGCQLMQLLRENQKLDPSDRNHEQIRKPGIEVPADQGPILSNCRLFHVIMGLNCIVKKVL
jgi:hypothetical protein